MTKILQLNFGTAGGKKMTLTVDEPRENLTTEEVESAMQKVIDSGVFGVNDTKIKSVISARIIERTVTELVEG